MTDKKNQASQNSKNEEIDLLQLFKSFGDFIVGIFKGFFNIILQFIIFSIRKWVYLFLAVLLGTGLSYLMSKTQQDLYHSDLVLKSNAVDNQEMISYINRLGNLTSRDNYPILANALNITEEEAEKIHTVNAFWFIDVNKDGLV